MNKVQEFFSKKWALIVAPILYFVGILGTDIDIMLDDAVGGAYYLGGDLFIAFLVLVICLSFAKHNKNVMKAVVGGVLMYACSGFIGWAMDYSFYYNPEYDYWFDLVFGIALGALCIAFFVIHLVLGSNHKSQALLVKINLVIGLAMIACIVAWELCCVLFCDVDVFYGVSWSMYQIAPIVLVMNIESKIDFFKQARDEKEAAEAESETVEA